MLSRDDINLVRCDGQLTGLPIVLDPDTFLAILKDLRPDGNPKSLQITSVRYKPATSCLVAYRLVLDDGQVDLHAKVHPAGERANLRNGRRKKNSSAPACRASQVLQEHGIEVSVFPDDARLKVLDRLANAKSRRSVLQGLLPNRPNLWGGRLRTVRYSPENSFVADLITEDGPAAVLKLYSHSRYPKACWCSNRFESRGNLRVARRLARSHQHRLLAVEWLPGRPLSEAVDDRSLNVDEVAGIGNALHEFHAQKCNGLKCRSRKQEARSLLSLAVEFGYLGSKLSGQIYDLGRHLAQRLADEAPVQATVHGEFHSEQVLLHRNSVSIRHPDAAVCGDPAIDLGSFIARLEWCGLREESSSGGIQPQKRALLEGYGVSENSSLSVRADLYTAVGLLRLVPHCFQRHRSNWKQTTQAVLDRADAILNTTDSE